MTCADVRCCLRWPHDLWPEHGQHRAADRPLRADDAPGRARRRDRGPAVRLRGVHATTARGPQVRRPGRYRARPGGDRAVPVRRRTSSTAWPTSTWSTTRRWTTCPRTASPGRSSGTRRVRRSSRRRRSWWSRASFAEAVLLETVVLSILNFDSAVASAASRMTSAAVEPPVLEMGARRAHEQAAVAASRAAVVAGFAGTSNLEAGRRYGLATIGTAAHAFTLLHDDEADRVRGAGRRAGAGDHAAGGHVRRAARRRERPGGRRHRARCRAARLGRPRGARARGPPAARRGRCEEARRSR